MKRGLFILLVALLSISAFAVTREDKQRTIAIVSVNDIHGEMNRFARLAYVVDSVRALYDYTLVFSAGDNRSGNAWSDKYPISSYPVMAMMNQVGFDASALGNHEFDATPKGFTTIAKLAAFPYLCANIETQNGFDLPIEPYQIFNVGGFKIGVVSVIKINNGRIDSHPNNLIDMCFASEQATLERYVSQLRGECDMVILLSHLGHEDDCEMARNVAGLDLIIGGHSHTFVDGAKRVNDVPICQAGNGLKYATINVISLIDNKIDTIQTQSISLRSGATSALIENMIDYFKATNEEMQRVIGQNISAINTVELGSLMCDALREYTGVDFAFQNGGGVRIDALAKGQIIVADVFNLDPFGNEAVSVILTGKELKALLAEQYRNDYELAGFVSGGRYELTLNEKGEVEKIEVYLADGKKICDKKSYRVATNSYVLSTSATLKGKQVRHYEITTSQIIIDYISKKGEIDYAGKRCVKVIK